MTARSYSVYQEELVENYVRAAQCDKAFLIHPDVLHLECSVDWTKSIMSLIIFRSVYSPQQYIAAAFSQMQTEAMFQNQTRQVDPTLVSRSPTDH